jgi:hypothetical protein
VPQKHCACARPKTATHCPKSAAMAHGATPSDRLSHVNTQSHRQDKKDIFKRAQTTAQNRARSKRTEKRLRATCPYSLGGTAQRLQDVRKIGHVLEEYLRPSGLQLCILTHHGIADDAHACGSRGGDAGWAVFNDDA